MHESTQEVTNIISLVIMAENTKCTKSPYPVSILYKSIVGRYRPVRVAEGPITARCRFIKNAIAG